MFWSCQGWGLTVTLGVPKAKPEVSAHYGLLLSGRTLKGSLFGGWRPKSDIPLVEKYANKVIWKLLQKKILFDAFLHKPS
jgi:alcohol dehydrogenase